jgi:hypothetical protein
MRKQTSQPGSAATRAAPKERTRSHATASSAGEASANSGGPVGPVQMCSYFMETLSQALSLPDAERQSKYAFLKNYFRELPEDVSACFSSILEACRQLESVVDTTRRAFDAGVCELTVDGSKGGSVFHEGLQRLQACSQDFERHILRLTNLVHKLTEAKGVRDNEEARLAAA